MNDYLSNLLRRAVDPHETIMPRPIWFFEMMPESVHVSREHMEFSEKEEEHISERDESSIPVTVYPALWKSDESAVRTIQDNYHYSSSRQNNLDIPKKNVSRSSQNRTAAKPRSSESGTFDPEVDKRAFTVTPEAELQMLYKNRSQNIDQNETSQQPVDTHDKLQVASSSQNSIDPENIQILPLYRPETTFLNTPVRKPQPSTMIKSLDTEQRFVKEDRRHALERVNAIMPVDDQRSVTVPLPNKSQVIIGHLKVEIIQPEPPPERQVPMRPAQSIPQTQKGGRRGIPSKLRFGLGQV